MLCGWVEASFTVFWVYRPGVWQESVSPVLLLYWHVPSQPPEQLPYSGDEPAGRPWEPLPHLSHTHSTEGFVQYNRYMFTEQEEDKHIRTQGSKA